MSFAWNSSAPRGYFAAFVRGSGGWANAYRPVNGYGIEMSSDGSSVLLQRVVNGTRTVLNTTDAQPTGSGAIMVRLEAIGNVVRYRMWRAGEAEPAGWAASVTDSAIKDAGKVHLTLIRSSNSLEAKHVDVRSLTLTGP
jgi:hypothetical protein